MKENGKVTNADTNMLAHAIGDLIGSVPSMKIGVLTYFKNTQKKLDKINKLAFDEQTKILKKHVKLDSNGGWVLTEPTQEEIMAGIQPEYVYKNGDDGRQKAEAEMKKLFGKNIVTEFKKINPSMIANLDIVPAKNPKFSVIMEMLFEEEVEMEVV
tara:strand:- start:2268 stop:2735 length:468 start_codon:yes stop_codon:yes gene_type:complete